MTVAQYTVYYLLVVGALVWYGPGDFAADLAVFLADLLGHPVEPRLTRMLVLAFFGIGALMTLIGWLGRIFGRIGKNDPFLD